MKGGGVEGCKSTERGSKLVQYVQPKQQPHPQKNETHRAGVWIEWWVGEFPGDIGLGASFSHYNQLNNY